jgi:hypothetical protein
MRPTGLSHSHVGGLVKASVPPLDPVVASTLMAASDLFEEFTYLADTSNFSNDGQDLRITKCRDRILALCDSVDGQLSRKTVEIETPA